MFERRGWTGAPRYLGLDGQGREVLDYLDGEVAWTVGRRRAAGGDRSLALVAQLVRAFHDLSSGSSLTGAYEVVCHNDLSPRNTVYTVEEGGWRPFAFIDWDNAAPGERIHDLAHVCWQYLGLGPGIEDVPDTARRIRLICDAYGLAERCRLLDTVLWWQERCWRGIEAGAARGEPGMVRLRDTGTVGGEVKHSTPG